MATDALSAKFQASLQRFARDILKDPDFVARALDDELVVIPESEGPDAMLLAWRVISRQSIAKVLRRLEKLVDRCESPIEEAMLFAICIVASRKIDNVRYKVGDSVFGDIELDLSCLQIEPQAPVGKYKVDFLLRYKEYAFPETSDGKTDLDAAPAWKTGSLVIECDGHDFHERTSAQAAHDKRRDRYLQTQGHLVFHYTGREIWGDVIAAANESIETLIGHTNK